MRENLDAAALAVLGDGIRVMEAMRKQLSSLGVDMERISASQFCRYAARTVAVLHIAREISSPLIVIPQFPKIAYQLGGSRLSDEVQTFIAQRVDAEVSLIEIFE